MFKNFKAKYIKESFIYKIYRYYKYRPNKSCSNLGEEILVKRIFKDTKHGIYIDVGALNPKVGSLTYSLYKKGWTGINLDLTKENIKLFKFFRKKDISLRVAISSSGGVINSYIFDPGSGLNTLNRKWANDWSKKINKPYTIEPIKKITLNSLLDEYKIKKNFDFLNIDVETHELDVLKGLNFNKYKPFLIACEIHSQSIDELVNCKVSKLLKQKGYFFIAHYYHTSFFCVEKISV